MGDARFGKKHESMGRQSEGWTLDGAHVHGEDSEGLHHFKERISQDDIDEVLKEYKEKGIQVTQTGQFKEDFHYYLNTEPKLDFVLELGNCPLLNLPKDEFPIYPPEKD